MKPFIIFALPRTGTNMLVDALQSHPDIPDIMHEFRGTEAEYWAYPYVLVNEVRDWMLNPAITKIHVHRDPVAGARSMLLFDYFLPKNTVIDEAEVSLMAEKRRRWDKALKQASQYSVAYEDLCGDKQATTLSKSIELCAWLGVKHQPLITSIKKQVYVAYKHKFSGVIDQHLPIGTVERTIKLPHGKIHMIQFVLDRLKMENETELNERFGRVAFFVNGVNHGGTAWGGGVAEDVYPRPGGRRLWSTSWLRNPPEKLKEISVVFNAIVPFTCHADVDIY